MTKKVVGAKIACLDFSLNKAKMKMGVQVLIDDPSKLEGIRQRYVSCLLFFLVLNSCTVTRFLTASFCFAYLLNFLVVVFLAEQPIYLEYRSWLCCVGYLIVLLQCAQNSCMIGFQFFGYNHQLLCYHMPSWVMFQVISCQKWLTSAVCVTEKNQPTIYAWGLVRYTCQRAGIKGVAFVVRGISWWMMKGWCPMGYLSWLASVLWQCWFSDRKASFL